MMENNNKILTPLPYDKKFLNLKYSEEHDCDTCLNYENGICKNELAINFTHSLGVEEPDFVSNIKICEVKSTSSANVFQPDNVLTCNSDSLILPVQKSSSAPTFYNTSSSLSPRFCRLAANYHRRSRHLSDRSSTSEEQFSDDEVSPIIKMAGITKFSRGKDIGLRKTRLLGSLEESLLHYRIPVKHQVIGFKVLLGASGSFCPTQLTVPAVSSFYELDGHSVLTPYVVRVV